MQDTDRMIERLLEIGRRQGALSTSDLKSALPVNDMTMADIARIVAKLEEAGIPVEIDDEFLTASRVSSVAPSVSRNGHDPSEAQAEIATPVFPDVLTVTPTAPPSAEPVADAVRRGGPNLWTASMLTGWLMLLVVIGLIIFARW